MPNIIKRAAVVIRTTAPLTNGYVTCTGVVGSDATFAGDGALPWTQLVLQVTPTLASLTEIDLQVFFSYDNATWYAYTSEGTVSGVGTVTPHTFKIAQNTPISIPIPIAYPYIEVVAQGQGTVTSSDCLITAQLIRTVATNI